MAPARYGTTHRAPVVCLVCPMKVHILWGWGSAECSKSRSGMSLYRRWTMRGAIRFHQRWLVDGGASTRRHDAQHDGALLSPLARAVGVGPVRWTWKRPNVVEGRLAVQTEIGVCPSGRLSIGILTARPDTVRLQYIVNDVAVFRVCINEKHNGWSPMTHSHTYIPATGAEREEKLPAFCPIPRGPTVATGTYERSLKEFAALVSVALPPGYWNEPERSH